MSAGASRYRLLALLAAWYAASSSALRVMLTAKAVSAGLLSLDTIPSVLLTGTGYDALTALYVCGPFAAYLLLLPQRIYAARWHRAMLHGALAASAFGIAYLAVVEYFFFDEFNARFNFVAVEYLIYPHEVFVNIWQSYPVGKALAASAAAGAAFMLLSRAGIAAALASRTRLRDRLMPAGAMLVVLGALHATVDLDTGRRHGNRVADEIAANGVYSFFNAAINNDLDYPEYYLTIDPQEAAARARRLVAQPNATFIPDSRNPIVRRIRYDGPPKPLHVIVVLEESLGAEFVGAYGDSRRLTPNIDRLAHASPVFTNVYATGTRTVRGMEAVTASFPPVPAESIVKRTGNERLFNWSTVMSKNGYSPTFIYGGYGTFDNMNYFFGHNGHRVIDRTDMDAPRFANIWGVSDEDLFRNTLRVLDDQQARGEKIFSVIMTTSNHKPFTFPDGVDGVKASGGGRDAGVPYADYTLGRFVDALRQRPWSKDSLLVVVADHGARVYGRESIPLPSYRIPFLVYSPSYVAPGTFDGLVSQLDVAPTVLGLLLLSHDSAFFGRDVLAGDTQPHPRAVLNGERAQACERPAVSLGPRRFRRRCTVSPAVERAAAAGRYGTLFPGRPRVRRLRPDGVLLRRRRAREAGSCGDRARRRCDGRDRARSCAHGTRRALPFAHRVVGHRVLVRAARALYGHAARAGALGLTARRLSRWVKIRPTCNRSRPTHRTSIRCSLAYRRKPRITSIASASRRPACARWSPPDTRCGCRRPPGCVPASRTRCIGTRARHWFPMPLPCTKQTWSSR